MTVTYLRARLQPTTRQLTGRRSASTRPLRDEPRPSDGLVVDQDRRTVAVDGRRLELTRREFDLLAHLVAHPRLVFTRGQILRAVWQQPAVGDCRTVDVHVARLRTKLGTVHRHLLRTVRGVGYKFDPGAAATPAARP
ncbi:hypothetical protein DN069_19580 [Streptacidiphilus pinicola]|uniref:OmpR/PhoB-type domain-containing protein n=1 Tax=Streptacidiphilus pinicola TaxID=2219663 RepID=A0A2X0K8Y8_9ACTN|nr:winged helix-turn-helix domain-containing protein [Streptacidiphilus pinicola]RAG83959.1 hypothetical protein DN069_19580 [Streptacidiphilus pinicola]